MSVRATQLIRRETDDAVAAELHDGLRCADLQLIERSWASERARIMAELSRKGVARLSWPESLHWDWSRKAPELELLATRGLTAAEFAAAHRITMQELVSLERGQDPAPSPRTIRVLAKAAGVSASPLLQLAGCATPIDPELSREALRFITGPVPDAKLTREEARRFRAFVKVLARPA